MDSVFTWAYNSLMNELTQGMEHTKQLRAYLSAVASTSEETPNLLVQMILSSYEQSLLILKLTGSPIQSKPAVDGRSTPRSDEKKRSFNDHQEFIDISKKRKSQPTWTEQVKFDAESGFEGPTDDGYNWRKYGQKDILGAKYPRSYYRCMYRHMRNCWATKQVQRLNDDPTAFEIIYKRSHTCHLPTKSTLEETSVPEKEASQHELMGSGYSPYFVGTEEGFDSFEGLIDDGYSWRKYGLKCILGAKYPRGYYRCIYRHIRNCRATKQVQRSDDDPTAFWIIYKGSHTCRLPTNSTLQETSVVPEKEASQNSPIVGRRHSPSSVCSTTPRESSKYFSVSSCHMNDFGIVHNLDHSESYLSDIGIFLDLHHSDSDRTDTLSANTSTTTSSINGDFPRLDFSIWSKRLPQTEHNSPQKDD